MADGVETQLDCHGAMDSDHFRWHFESAFDDSVTSTDDKQDGSNTKVTQQTSTAVDNAEKLSDHQVLEAMNKLLKVCIMSILISIHFYL